MMIFEKDIADGEVGAGKTMVVKWRNGGGEGGERRKRKRRAAQFCFPASQIPGHVALPFSLLDAGSDCHGRDARATAPCFFLLPWGRSGAILRGFF
jgi:hypothetical protein